ncbi:Major facilitator superfamily multidrug transporter [Drechslerella dactyloides]|uniref:Major facilitator superfamily multidrug transporter n=1 Tax=Drechslerella dactyloides TaxID=74499 RepID=A0AAD6NH40_DREDA|nr:Major facilitator superfamily multidrug transporter [Drechslerella dactyloides]
MMPLDTDDQHRYLLNGGDEASIPSLNFSSFTALTDLIPTKTQLNKRAGDTIGPEWFYRRGPRKRCHRREFVYNLIPLDYPGFGISVADFPDWKGNFANRELAYKTITTRQGYCSDCYCDKNGRLSVSPKWYLKKNGQCDTAFQANRCMVVYGCYCWVDLGQPKPTATGLSLSDYQKALDKMPHVFKFQHKYYKWVHGLGDDVGDSLTFSDTRTNVAGTKEPYSIEGPSERESWNWLGNLQGGLAFGQSAKIMKRETIDADEPEKSPNDENDRAGKAHGLIYITLVCKPPAMAPRTARPDFPTHQLIVLSICRLVEPIAFTSIVPYIYYMVSYFHVASNDGEIAMWTGSTIAAFAFAEMLTGILWGNLSDRIGRKPVLVSGLLGTGLSMLLFGLAPSMPLALAARALGGLLNGNVGVIQTTVAELVPKREYQPRAFSIMPFVWSLGSIIGPSLGGLLAEPVQHYPEYFSRGGLFDQFPYLLPNLACAIICFVGAINGILFLDETHVQLIHQPDRGRAVGFWIQDTLSALLSRQPTEKLPPTSPPAATTETTPLLTAPTPSTPSPSPSTPTYHHKLHGKPTKIWTPQVIYNVIAYGIIAFHTITYDQLLSVFLQSPVSSRHFKNPLQFTGGFSLDTRTMGLLFSYQGVLSTFFQFAIFAPFVRWAGVQRTFRVVAAAYPLVYFLTPYIAWLPTDNDALLYAVIYAMLSVKTVCGCLMYPINSILLTNASPSLLVLGTINGVAGSLASCMRAIAPVLMGWLFSRGVAVGVMGLSWWVSGLVAALGAVQAVYITEDEEDGHVGDSGALGKDEEAVGVVVVEDAVRPMEAGEVVVAHSAGDGRGVVSSVQDVAA